MSEFDMPETPSKPDTGLFGVVVPDEKANAFNNDAANYLNELETLKDMIKHGATFSPKQIEEFKTSNSNVEDIEAVNNSQGNNVFTDDHTRVDPQQLINDITQSMDEMIKPTAALDATADHTAPQVAEISFGIPNGMGMS